MNLYIIHNPSLKERDEYIADFIKSVSQILPFNLKYMWSNAGQDLSDDIISTFKDADGYNNSITKIKNASSLTLHHMECLIDFLNSNVEHCIILEDDVFLDSINNFIDAINISKNTIFDTIYLGEGCLPTIHNGQPKGLIRINKSRCTEAIIYSKQGAKKILDYFNKTQENKNTCCHLDFFFNLAYNDIEQYINYHYHPAPIKQGTCTGKLKSTIQD